MDTTILHVIYTDGACRGNPGPGGWGVFVSDGPLNGQTFSGGEPLTTNNRMELLAAIEAVKLLDDNDELVLFTDSQYVKQGINEWIHNWKKNGWKTSARKPVKNADLWKLLDAQCSRVNVTWRWVKGHSGDFGNEKADALANEGIEEVLANS